MIEGLVLPDNEAHGTRLAWPNIHHPRAPLMSDSLPTSPLVSIAHCYLRGSHYL